MLLAAFSSPLLAWEWKSKNYTVLSTLTEDDKTTLSIQGPLSNTFQLVYSGILNEKMQDKVVSFHKEFVNWQSMEIKEIRFEVKDMDMKMVVLPQVLKVDGQDISANVPAGLFLYFEEGMTYDFRMMKGVAFMRIKGMYINESELIKKMSQAMKNPDAYIKRNDPDYILSKLEELDMALETVQLENYRLKIAVLSLQNRGLFGKVTPIDTQLLKKVIQMRKDEPTISRQELEAKLKAQGEKFNRKSLYLIFAVVYNEF